MSEQLVSDELWQIVEPLLLAEPSKARGGRPLIPDRAMLSGIVFVLRSGIPWRMLPKEMGFGSGITCWRRLREWQKAGVWHRLHRTLLDRLGRSGKVDWSRACLDSASVPAKRGRSGRLNLTDRGKSGSKHHLLTDRNGVPLAVVLTAANVHDSKVFEELVDAVEPIKRPGRGRPRKRPEKLHADKAYDFPRCRAVFQRRGIKSRIARRGKDSSERLGQHRWVMERTLAWMARYRRLMVRYERRADIHEALLHLACALVCPCYARARSRGD